MTWPCVNVHYVAAHVAQGLSISYAETLANARAELKLSPKKYNAVVSDYYLPDGEAKNISVHQLPLGEDSIENDFG